MQMLEHWMTEKGAQADSIRYRLAGGVVAAAGDEVSSDGLLAGLLALRNGATDGRRIHGAYTIESVRVPLSIGTTDHNGRLNQVNLLVGAQEISYCVNENAPPIDEDETPENDRPDQD